MEGVVKFFNEEKGYGFVKCEDGGKDCFLHHTDIKMEGFRKVSEGQRVEFDIAETERGRKAQNCVPL